MTSKGALRPGHLALGHHRRPPSGAGKRAGAASARLPYRQYYGISDGTGSTAVFRRPLIDMLKGFLSDYIIYVYIYIYVYTHIHTYTHKYMFLALCLCVFDVVFCFVSGIVMVCYVVHRFCYVCYAW